MPRGIQVGDEILVPAQLLGLRDSAQALVKRRVLQKAKRSVTVDAQPGTLVTLGTSNVHRAAAVLVLRIGDLGTEVALLDPVAKALDHHLRLLLGADFFHIAWIRTIHELRELWLSRHAYYTHVFLVAHGRPDGIMFLDEGWVGADRLAGVLSEGLDDLLPKTFISAACETGRASFAKGFSQSDVCGRFVGPYRAIHGATAVAVCQRYLNEFFLHGHQPKTAIKRAAQGMPSGNKVVLWEDGDRSPL